MEIYLFVDMIRKNTEAVKGHGPVTASRGARNTKALETPEYNAQGDISLPVTYFKKTYMLMIIITIHYNFA